MNEIPGKIYSFVKERYLGITNSIAFYPAIIMLLFLAFTFLSISFDFSETGKSLKSQLEWLKLRDSSTARNIASSIVTGIISLTVFSFTMVMIVLNQTASQMSNRILDNLIGSRFQQVVLGIYIGTIVYALFLLSTIRDIDSGIQIPAFSTYFLILLTIIDLFIFIYFLHYITQSVRYEVIIRKTHDQTREAMGKYCSLEIEPAAPPSFPDGYPLRAEKSGIYTDFNKTILKKLCSEKGFSIYIIHPPGTFILKGLAVLETSEPISDDEVKKRILDAVTLQNSDTIEENYQYGFRQLSEVAVKALSPGINDPGTAILSLRALFSLFTFRMCHFPENVIMDEDKNALIFTKEFTFENLFVETLLPIWDYGRNDRMIQQELYRLLTQLQDITPNDAVKYLLQEVRQVQHTTGYSRS
jgi:uncharacterized membrane protein